jgi:ketosteroid isomerase-like protein
MSQENVEIVKAVHPPPGTDLVRWFGPEADAESPFMAAAALFDRDFEFVADGAQAIATDIAPVGQGLQEFAIAWREWMAPWEVYRTEPEEFVDAGDDRVLVLVRDYGRLRGSAAEVETVGGAVWTVRAGKIVRIQFFLDRRKALEAAGLSE